MTTLPKLPKSDSDSTVDGRIQAKHNRTSNIDEHALSAYTERETRSNNLWRDSTLDDDTKRNQMNYTRQSVAQLASFVVAVVAAHTPNPSNEIHHAIRQTLWLRRAC